MSIEPYPFVKQKGKLTYEFMSVGRRGTIEKIVEFRRQIGTDLHVYLLYFGDSYHGTEIDDAVVSNNGDARKVVTTVLKIVDHFTGSFPGAMVYFEGRDRVRSRLYRMVICSQLESLVTSFTILGCVDDDWEMFEGNRPYKSFLVARNLN